MIYNIKRLGNANEQQNDNLMSRSRGVWKKLAADKLSLIHYTAQKNSMGGVTMLRAPESGHAGPELSENNTTSTKKNEASGVLRKNTRVSINLNQ